MNDILLVGTGRMARAYVAILKHMEKNVVVVGRSEEGSSAFTRETGLEAHAGGLARFRAENRAIPDTAIIVVDVPQLAVVALETIDAGCTKILLEKPGALSREELKQLKQKADASGANVRIAYNRRYLASVLKARELIAEFGGPVSFAFEFNERTNAKDSIRALGVDPITEQNWFLANSTHVVDLAFYLGGEPKTMEGFSATGPLWAPHPSLYSGAGITMGGIPFIYHANWEVPGPWDVVVGTEKGNIVLRPLESVAIERGGVVESVAFDHSLDTAYKPGLYRQVEAFLSPACELPTLEEQIARFAWYEKMLTDRCAPLG